MYNKEYCKYTSGVVVYIHIYSGGDGMNLYESVDMLNLLSQAFQIFGILLCILGLVLSFRDDKTEDKTKLKKLRIVRAVVLALALLLFLGTIITRNIASKQTEKIIQEYNSVLTE